MSQVAKAQEPSMEEILASIRRIIADDEGGKPASKAVEPPPAAPERPTEHPLMGEPSPMSQDDIDSMLSGFSVPEEKPAPHLSAPGPETTDVLELTEAMQVRPPPADSAGFRTIDANSDVVFTEPAEPHRPFAAEARPFEEEDIGPPLLSDQATAAVTSAFGSLAHTVLVQNGRTLEDLVRDMLRPLLKTWLDDNLPTIVERLVRTEIERVSRGR